MKRFICIILSVLLLISMTACGNKKKVSSDTITIMGAPAFPSDKDTETEKWLEEKYGVKIEAISVTSGYYEKLATMLASGDVPDVMFINEPENWQPLVDQGFIAEIPKETIEKYAPRHYAAIEETDPRIWAISSYKNSNWAVPKIMGDEYGTVMLWRKDWLDKLGITEIPKTIEEYEEAFIKIRNNDPDGNGKKDTYGLTGCGGATQRQFDAYFGAYGVMPGQWIVKDGVVTNSTTSDEAKEALELLHKWYDMELIDPEMITDEQDDYLKKFIAGRVATLNTALVNASLSSPNGVRNKENFEATNSGLVWEEAVAIEELPTGPDGDRGDWLWGPRANFVVFGSHLEDDPEKLEKILGMLDDINYDEETALKVVWGEKGVTYDYQDPAVGAESGLKYLPPYDSDSAARASKGIYGFFNLFTPASNWADTKIVSKYSNPELMAEQDKYALKDKYGDELMRPYLPSAKRYQAELDKFKTTAYSEFITGKRSIDKWDDFVNEYMRKGGTQLQKEAQEFYDTNMK